MPLLQILSSCGRLAGIFVNEYQVLDIDSTWREFHGMRTLFQRCTRIGISSVVVFMTATLKAIRQFHFKNDLFFPPHLNDLTSRSALLMF